jgi:hypothetical protein
LHGFFRAQGANNVGPRHAPHGLNPSRSVSRVHHHYGPLHSRRSMRRFQLPRKLGQCSGPAVPGSRTGRCDKRVRCRCAALPRCGIGPCSIASTRSRRYRRGSTLSVRVGPGTTRHATHKHGFAACGLLGRGHRHQEHTEEVERQMADELGA